MKKLILICTLFLLLCSCGMLKQIDFFSKLNKMEKQTQVTYGYGKKLSFIFDRNAILIPCKMNDTTLLLYYNSTTGLLYEQISANSEFPKCSKTIKLKTKNSSKQRIILTSGLKYYNIESDFFHFINMVGIATSLSSDTIVSECASEKNPSRFVIGQEFPDKKDVMLLSFSDTTITFLDSNSIYDTTGFTWVKSLHTCEGRSIFLTIDSVEYAFLYNTGYEGCIFLPERKRYKRCFMVDGKSNCVYFHVEYENHKKESDLFFANYRGENNSGIVTDTLITQQTHTIKMGEWDNIAGNIQYSKKAQQPIIGMAFISHFDWIIDKNNGKIYAKQISNIDSFFNLYRVNIRDGKLQVVSLPVGEKQYQLLSIIDSVNGIPVNSSNICQMRDLLNKENGFKENVIVVR